MMELLKSYRFLQGFVCDILLSLMTMMNTSLFIDIEIQRQYEEYPLINRALFYIAYMLVRQYDLFKDFTYDMLCKCYSIWFIVDCYKSNTNNEIYSMSDYGKDINQDECDLCSIKLIYLNPSNDPFLYTLLSTDTSYEEKIEAFKKANVYYDNDTLKEVKAMSCQAQQIHNQTARDTQIALLTRQLKNKLGSLSTAIIDEFEKCSQAKLDRLTDDIFIIESEADIVKIIK